MAKLDSLILEPTVDVVGAIYLFNNETNWNQDIPNYEPVEIHAQGEDGVVWTTTSDSFAVQHATAQRNTEFQHPCHEYNAASVSDYIVNVQDGMNPEPEFDTNPANSTVILNVFTDLGDGVFENGTAIRPEIQLIPVSEIGERVNITSDDYSEDGIVEVVLSPGIYAISTNNLDHPMKTQAMQALRSMVSWHYSNRVDWSRRPVLVPIVDA